MGKYYNPPCPEQANGTSIVEYISAREPPVWSDQVQCPFSRTSCLMHLGQSIGARHQVGSAVAVLLCELRPQLNELHQQPIQMFDHVLLLNSMVLPRSFYKIECLPVTDEQTVSSAKVLETFVFGVMGLPLIIAKKTLYSHRSHGVGLGYFPVLHPTRVLDVLHRNQQTPSLSTSARATMLPYTFFGSALSKLGPTTTPSMVPCRLLEKRVHAQGGHISPQRSCAHCLHYSLPTQTKGHIH